MQNDAGPEINKLIKEKYIAGQSSCENPGTWPGKWSN